MWVPGKSAKNKVMWVNLFSLDLQYSFLFFFLFFLQESKVFILFSILVVNYDGLLRVANLFILGNEKCNQYLKGKITVNESEICAVAETIGAGPCEVNITFPMSVLKPSTWLFFSQK